MSYIPTVEEAYEILKKYNKDEFHLKHGKIVSGVMGYFAEEYDPEHVDYWKVVGMLHDLDFEMYPEQHCIKGQELMKELDLDEGIIRSTASHGYGITVDIKPELYMEKVLYAIDELTGLIGAVAIMRPSKSVSDLEVKSVMKKFKTASFAAGCSREVIQKGADMLEMELTELIDKTIHAMRSLIPEMEI
ncbi:hydrolase [Anaerocolumna aminovalerica]|uniref:Predicted hydrolase, HD superfamily n=1 Tax=Anaerocolumna aminovalerica TaxID=1527 RepID=A0A1I5GLB3_9FIRM|nr:hydrolase [Anaerocolumna aminovalerica]MBU5334668.1 hydrolase [Anaerocolumna aminovalerica]SFO36788.1 Predicted hydrolase, HD superfamily [Anaerocolumna aminovalerica]